MPGLVNNFGQAPRPGRYGGRCSAHVHTRRRYAWQLRTLLCRPDHCPSRMQQVEPASLPFCVLSASGVVPARHTIHACRRTTRTIQTRHHGVLPSFGAAGTCCFAQSLRARCDITVVSNRSIHALPCLSSSKAPGQKLIASSSRAVPGNVMHHQQAALMATLPHRCDHPNELTNAADQVPREACSALVLHHSLRHMACLFKFFPTLGLTAYRSDESGLSW